MTALWGLAFLPATAQTAAVNKLDPPPQYHRPSEAELARFVSLMTAADEVQKRDPVAATNEVRQAFRVYEESFGPNHPETSGRYFVQGYFAAHAGRHDEGEELLWQALTIHERTSGPDSVDVANDLAEFAGLYMRELKFTEAEAFSTRAAAIYERKANAGLGVALAQLGQIYAATHRGAQADALFERSIRVLAHNMREFHSAEGGSWERRAENLVNTGRFVEAETAIKAALQLKPEENPQVLIRTLSLRGAALSMQGRNRDAEPVLQSAVAAARAHVDPESWDRHQALARLALVEWRLGRQPAAVAHFRESCIGQPADQVYADVAPEVSDCLQRGTAAMLDWAEMGGGRAPQDLPAALRSTAFEEAQIASLSAAGGALAMSGARVEALSRGEKIDLQSYETAMAQQARLEAQFAMSFTTTGPSLVVERVALQQAVRHARDAKNTAIARIAVRSPIFWDLQGASALELSALQARSGRNAQLLNESEVLLVFTVPPGQDRGWVFAVTKDHFATARLTLSSVDLAARVRRLRAGIDPKTTASSSLAPSNNSGPAFDRQAAYELYLALLGDSRIANVIADKPDLLIVPDGPLTSLPPAVLVTRSPSNNFGATNDPATLRATNWLLRTKSITVLPTVGSLRVLRQLLPQRGWRAAATEPLVAFADPNFGGATVRSYETPTEVRGEVSSPAPIEAYFRDGVSASDVLRTLPRLPGTAIEAEALRKSLGAGKSSLHLWNEASETNLRRLQADGLLSRSRVVEFATHGLLIASASRLGVAQPALALAAPPVGTDPAVDDGLLTANEVSALTLNADWVILSACNTATPDRTQAEGLSGLMRSFFDAGARSVLVSHWRVRDDVAARLIPDVLQRLAEDSTLTKAQALKAASLAILDDPTHPDLAQPRAWASFVLVGDPSR